MIDYVKIWPICAKHKATQVTLPMLSRDIPDSPWQDLATNVFTLTWRNTYLWLIHLSNTPLSSRLLPRPQNLYTQNSSIYFHNMDLTNDSFRQWHPLFLWCLYGVHDNARHPPHHIISLVFQVKWFHWKTS